MTDRELLTELLEVINTNIDREWIHSESTPSEEFEELYDMIYNHIQKEPTWDLK
jgi:hypothetical protein